MTNTKFHFERLFYKAMVGTGIGGKRDEIIRDAKRKQKYWISTLALSLSEGVT